MFFVFNKDKITAYIVTVFTVIALFLTASVINRKEESVETSTNEVRVNNIIKNNMKEDIINENNIILNTN